MADIWGNNRVFAATGGVLLLCSCLPLPVFLRVILAGIGNACYHVGGGRDSLIKSKNMLRLGIFVAPGAIGICLAPLLHKNNILFTLAIVATGLCSLSALLINSRDLPQKSAHKPHISTSVLMFLVVIARSFGGMCMQTPWKIGLWAVGACIASAAGKALGGLVADHFGGKRTAIFSLLFSAVLFCLPNLVVAGILGVLLFNMTMPITLRKGADALQGLEGFAFGLLTLALFLGYLPSFAGLQIPWWGGAALCIVSAGLMGVSRNAD